MGQPDASDVHVPDLVKPMPFASEHAARQTDPGQYSRFRRKNISDGVDAVLGFRDGESEIQSLRFDANTFTQASAKTWLEEHDFKTAVEPAKTLAAKSDPPNTELLILSKADTKRYTLGVVYEPDVPDTQKEFAKAEDIESAAWAFMANLQAMAKSGAELLKAARDGEDVEVDEAEVDMLIKGAGLDDEHLQVEKNLGTIVESYIAPCDLTIGEQVVKQGSWLLGVRWEPEMWKKIQKGERHGLSMYGRAERRAA